MVTFIGREAQLKLLEGAWRGEGGMLALVYGRRRVGKTELIRHFVRDKQTVFFTGKEAKSQVLIDDFLAQAALCFGYEVAKAGEVTGWKAAIRIALAQCRRPERLILAFDELQWAATASPELIGTLQELWDHEWKDSPRVGVILCTSFIAYALKLAGSQSPLFGRVTLNIPLHPFEPREAARFHPHYSITDQAQAYFICGGVPTYHRAFAPRWTFRENLTNALLSSSGALYREGETLLRAEFQEMPTYFTILAALAERPRRSTDLIGLIQVKDAHYYLERLRRVGYIQRILPLANRVPRTEARYAIRDPFLCWWFFFLFKNLSAVELLGPEEAFARVVAPQIDRFFASRFEDFCRDWLQRHYVTHEGATGEVVVGQYWRRETVQIDVVGKRTRDRWIDLGECKWGKVKSLADAIEELHRKAGSYPAPKDFSLGYRLFLHHRPAKPPDHGMKIHTLEEMLALE
jgi:uncharacterized protein